MSLTFAEEQALKESRGRVAHLRKGELVFSRPYGSWSSKWSEFSRRNAARIQELGIGKKPKVSSPVLFSQGKIVVTQADVDQWRQKWSEDNEGTEHRYAEFTQEQVIQNIVQCQQCLGNVCQEEAELHAQLVEDGMPEDDDCPLDSVDQLGQHLRMREGAILITEDGVHKAGHQREVMPQTWCIGRTGRFSFAKFTEDSDEITLKYEWRFVRNGRSLDSREREPEPQCLEWNDGTQSMHRSHFSDDVLHSKVELTKYAVSLARCWVQGYQAEVRNVVVIIREKSIAYGEVHRDFLKKISDEVLCPES